MKALFYCWIM